MERTNTRALDEALRRTAALVSVPDAVLQGLRLLVKTGTDQQLLHINPIEFAHDHGFAEQQAVTAFVGASRAGAFDFTWSLTCPLCGSYAHHDYFGQTVNIAARVQALAEGDELVLTDAAWRAPAVRELLQKSQLTERVDDAALKGVTEKVKVHTMLLVKPQPQPPAP